MLKNKEVTKKKFGSVGGLSAGLECAVAAGTALCATSSRTQGQEQDF